MRRAKVVEGELQRQLRGLCQQLTLLKLGPNDKRLKKAISALRESCGLSVQTVRGQIKKSKEAKRPAHRVA